MIIRIDNNTFFSICVEILKVGKNDFNLIQKEACVNIYPGLYFDLQGISQTWDNNLKPAYILYVSHLLNLLPFILKICNDFIKKFQRRNSSFSSFKKSWILL